MTAVVAVGGGHGTAVTLRAARRYAQDITAVVSVADDGGSSGRLRQLLDVVALGDLRRCLVALAAPDSLLAAAFEHRFSEEELAGHALGNLVLAGLAAAAADAHAGGLVTAVDEAARLLGAAGRVLPATSERVVLKAEVEDGQVPGGVGEVAGQVAVMSSGRIRRVSLVPPDARPPAEAVAALERADQVIIGPGSLYTSVLAAVAVPGIADAIAVSGAQRVLVCNLRPQVPETEGYTVADHVSALGRHRVEIDVVLCDTTGMALGPMGDGRAPWPRVVDRPLAGTNGLVHDPARLAVALADLLA